MFLNCILIPRKNKVNKKIQKGTKSMWHCSRELKCQQGDTLHTFGIYCSRGSHKFCVFMAKWLEL